MMSWVQEILNYRAATGISNAVVVAPVVDKSKCQACEYDLIGGWCSHCDLVTFVQDRDKEAVA